MQRGFKKLKPDLCFPRRVERDLLTVRLNAWRVIAAHECQPGVKLPRRGIPSRCDGVARRASRPMRIATESYSSLRAHPAVLIMWPAPGA
jgi:hypothetical protein